MWADGRLAVVVWDRRRRTMPGGILPPHLVPRRPGPAAPPAASPAHPGGGAPLRRWTYVDAEDEAALAAAGQSARSEFRRLVELAPEARSPARLGPSRPVALALVVVVLLVAVAAIVVRVAPASPTSCPAPSLTPTTTLQQLLSRCSPGH